MSLPEFVKIGVSYMRLSGTEYVTYGWGLPLRCVNETLTIQNFMPHLDGKKLTPITREDYEVDQGIIDT